MKHLTLGTAGHIDHGKTALVRALTGVDTDRLPEEKRRGITIDLGFARLPLDDTTQLSLIDVPGHEAFVRNMLAGATGIDLVLLVVAADEGVMPQTREHVAILDLLGIRRGVVAITKADLVEPDWLELVAEDVKELLRGGPLADAPLHVVSARSGQGIEELRTALRAAAATADARAEDDLFRMPVDRVFTVRGTGTVITGTVWSGQLRRDAQVRLEPAGIVARVRALQQHGVDCETVRAGERAAIAVAGVERHAIARGDNATDMAEWQAASILTVELRVLGDAPPLRPRQRVRVHLGTAEVLARVALPDGELPPGGTGVGQLRLERPLLARALDRLVIRSYSPVHTIAGGLVLEPAAPKRKRFPAGVRHALLGVATPGRALESLLALADPAGVPRRLLPLLTGRPRSTVENSLAGAPELVLVGDHVVSAGAWDACRQAIREAVHAFHAHRPMEDGADREALRRTVGGSSLFDPALHDLLRSGELVNAFGAIAAAGHQPAPAAADRPRLDRLAAALAAAGTRAPELEELPPELAGHPDVLAMLRLLEREGRLVRLSGGRWADASAISGAVSAVYAQLQVGSDLAVSDFKQVLNLSRKHLIPLLEYFDSVGITVRTGDVRRLTAKRSDASPQLPPAQSAPGPGAAASKA